jgi:Xaa-Pro aminopeptidase
MSPEQAEAARARHARVQAAMARRGVGAILLATPHLATFASGARRVQVAGSGGTLPWVVVRAGAPAATIFTTDPDGAPPWMPREMVEPLRWSRDRQLVRIAELVAGTAGTIAADVFSPALERLVAEAGRALVDAGPLLADAVAPRTEVEVALVARALAASRAALRAAMAAVAPGVSVGAVLGRFADAMAGEGAGFPLTEGIVWRMGEEPRRLVPDARVEAGDVLALEVGLYVGGHAGVAGDGVAADRGALASERRALAEALCAVAKRCRAGATTAELRAAAAAAGATAIDVLAHGLGVGVEPPIVRVDDDDATPLAAGTILVLAPVVGRFRRTRALLVTEGAARWLEAAP